MKIVINAPDFPYEFSVSKEVFEKLGLNWNGYGFIDNETFNIKSNNVYEYRSYSKLIKVIEELGEEKASNVLAKLKIIEIPDDVEWEIYGYGGVETIHEKHRIWG